MIATALDAGRGLPDNRRLPLPPRRASIVMHAFGRLSAAAALLLLVGAAPPVQAAEPVDPIDAALAQCLDSPDGQSTAGMVACLDTAYAAWDQAMNDVYDNLFDLLDAASLTALKAAQRKWIAFRDAEEDFLVALQNPVNGTIEHVVAAQGRVDLVKARTLQLRAYAQ